MGVDVFGDGDRAFAVQEQLATDLIVQLCGLEQATRFYEINNDMVRQVLQEMAATANRFAQLTGEGMTLTLGDHSVFVNRRLVRMDFNHYRKAQQLMESWHGLGIGEICFEDAATVESLSVFARSLMAALQDRSMVPYLFVKALGCVRLGGLQQSETSPKRWTGHEYALRAYSGLLVLVRRMLADLRQGRRPPMIRIKRALQVVVDLMREHQGLFLAATCHWEVNRELAAHLVNTAVLALLMGQRLGFGRRELMALGTAAVFHDLPKTGLKEPTLNRLEESGSMGEEDRQRVEQHWLKVLQRMVESGGFSDELLARLVVIFESQLEFGREDLYPEQHERRGLCLLSRIISLCSRYATYGWARAERQGMNPHAAMLMLMESVQGAEEIPLALLLLETVGLYPSGSLVLLNTGEVGVVKKPASLEQCEQPLVKIIVDTSGNAIEGLAMDLARDRTRSIVWPISSKSTEINPLACFE